MKWRDCSVLIFLGLLLQVSQVSEKTVLQQRAYMLFYVRHISSVPRRAPDITHTENRPSAASAKVEPTPLEGISTVKKVSMLPTSTHAAEAQQSKVNSNVRLLDFFHFRSFIAQLFLVFPFRLEWFPFAFGIFFFPASDHPHVPLNWPIGSRRLLPGCCDQWAGAKRSSYCKGPWEHSEWSSCSGF